jgi:4-hydroxy-tetrahydrodipicolinate synthase
LVIVSKEKTVTAFTFGLVQAPLTPFANGIIDYDSYGKLIDFHLQHGAEGLAVPTHTGESVSLTVHERQALLEHVIKQVGARVPVIANVSEAGTSIAASLATHARQVGAAALIASAPYYWKPPQSMLVEHFAAIGASGALPFFVYNSPDEMGGVGFTSKSVIELMGRLPYFAGLIDSSLDWQYMIEVTSLARAVKPDFQFVSGTEYMISARAIGATGVLSPLSNIAPRLVHELYDFCRVENYRDARGKQTELAALHRLLRHIGVPGLKAAARVMGRDCGVPRPPLVALANTDYRALAENLSTIKGISSEPRGWN